MNTMRLMISFAIFVIILQYSNFLLAKNTYNPDDFYQFNRTGNCPRCDLSGAVLTGYHESADLSGAKLTNAGVLFVGPKANFSNIDGTGARFSSDFRGAKFNGAKLINADFANFIFNGADFSNADVSGVNFYRASLLDAKISMAQLATASNICAAILPDGSRGPCK